MAKTIKLCANKVGMLRIIWEIGEKHEPKKCYGHRSDFPRTKK